MQIPLVHNTEETKRHLIESQFHIKIPQDIWMFKDPHRGFLEAYLMKKWNTTKLSIEEGNAIWTKHFIDDHREGYIKIVTNKDHPHREPKVFISPCPPFIEPMYIAGDGSVDFGWRVRGGSEMLLNLYQRIEMSLSVKAVYRYYGQTRF